MPSTPAVSIIIPVAPGDDAWRTLLPQLAPLAPLAEILLVSPTLPHGNTPTSTPVTNVGAAHGCDPGIASVRNHHATTQSLVTDFDAGEGCNPTAPRDRNGDARQALGSQPWAAPTGSISVRWVVSVVGRARQQNAGAAAARGTLLWFLHADSRVDATVLATLRDIDAVRFDALGWFRLGFFDGGVVMALNALGANLRSRLFGLPFGDQGLLLPARRFRALDGFDESLARGEDLDLVVRARHAGLPLQPLAGTLATSARRYRTQGWWRTTREHLALTWLLYRAARARVREGQSIGPELQQDCPHPGPPPQAGEGDRRGAANAAVAAAVFVKTPGRSPVKTRLAGGIGRARAEALHRACADAVAEVLRGCAPAVAGCFAVAEAGAGGAWPGLPTVAQGGGELGERLHRVYAALQARHGAVLLLGADAPQLNAALILHAARVLCDASPRVVFGSAADGGFWLFGGNRPIEVAVWRSVHYSRSDTGAQLLRALAGTAVIEQLPVLHDIDTVGDMAPVAAALHTLRSPTPGQRAVLGLLHDAIRHVGADVGAGAGSGTGAGMPTRGDCQ